MSAPASATRLDCVEKLQDEPAHGREEPVLPVAVLCSALSQLDRPLRPLMAISSHVARTHPALRRRYERPRSACVSALAPTSGWASTRRRASRSPGPEGCNACFRTTLRPCAGVLGGPSFGARRQGPGGPRRDRRAAPAPRCTEHCSRPRLLRSRLFQSESIAVQHAQRSAAASVCSASGSKKLPHQE
jgi:hypothetical protein